VDENFYIFQFLLDYKKVKYYFLFSIAIVSLLVMLNYLFGLEPISGIRDVLQEKITANTKITNLMSKLKKLYFTRTFADLAILIL
jgi:hypothetical protein